MKENSMNDCGRLKESELNRERAQLLRSNGSRTLQAGLVALLAIMALVLLSGCASVPVQGNSDPSQYNAETGYPAVGGAWPWVFHL